MSSAALVPVGAGIITTISQYLNERERTRQCKTVARTREREVRLRCATMTQLPKDVLNQINELGRMLECVKNPDVQLKLAEAVAALVEGQFSAVREIASGSPLPGDRS